MKNVIAATVIALMFSGVAHANGNSSNRGGGTSAVGMSPVEIQQILNDAYDAQREVADAKLSVKADVISTHGGLQDYLNSVHDAQRS